MGLLFPYLNPGTSFVILLRGSVELKIVGDLNQAAGTKIPKPPPQRVTRFFSTARP